MKRLAYIVAIALLVVAPALPASATIRHQLPPPPDPAPGGGEPVCANPEQCWYCGDPEPDGYQPCLDTQQNAACTCVYPHDGGCKGYGQCEYTG